MMDNGFVKALKEVVDQSSQADVAARAGIHPSTVCRMLNGERVGHMETVMRLLEAYPQLRVFFASADVQNRT